MNARITFSSLALATTLATGCTTTPELTGQLNSVASSAPQHGMNGAAPHVTPEDWIDQGALITLYAADKGYFDDVEVKRALECEKGMIGYLKAHCTGVMDKMQSTADLDGETEKLLAAGIAAFKSSWA